MGQRVNVACSQESTSFFCAWNDFWEVVRIDNTIATFRAIPAIPAVWIKQVSADL